MNNVEIVICVVVVSVSVLLIIYMPQYPQLALNLALILVHGHLLLPKPGRLKKMSRE